MLPAARAEKTKVDIGGVQQGMFIWGRFGPGMPEFWLTRRYPTGPEDLFTTVWSGRYGSCARTSCVGARRWPMCSERVAPP
ncbi:MAG: hypothetical protein U0R23_10950 [Candidatus Nanopelagicales bacterium]